MTPHARMSDWEDCGHHPEWVNKFDKSGACNHPDCNREAGDDDHTERPMTETPGTVDTEALRKVADFQDFAEHADLILAAARALDDFELAASRRWDIYWPSSDDEIHALLLEVERLRAGGRL